MQPTYNHINMYSFDLRIVFLNMAIRIKNFLHIQMYSFHTGLIKKLNRDLTFMLKVSERRNALLLKGRRITIADYESYRKKYLESFDKLYFKMRKTDFLHCKETNEIADNILSELYRTEGKLRMKAFPPDYKPNHEIDKALTEYASRISQESAIALLTSHEV